MEVVTSSSKKYQDRKETISRKDRRRDHKSKKTFYLQSSFIIDDLLHSGDVLFSDDVTIYINKIADELLKNNPELRKKISFYCVKSAAPNAFATDRGDIFVNLGLLAAMKTEAEIAFVLAHEIVHFEKKHNITSHVEFKKIERKLFNTKSYDKLLEKSNYSKKMELEADDLGLKKILESQYNPLVSDHLFDRLSLAHLPYEEMKIDSNFLNLPGLTLPSTLFLSIVEKGKPKDDDSENDASKYSTHPNIEKRED